MSKTLPPSELAELRTAFSDYESEDPCDPIEPLTYCSPDRDNRLRLSAHRGNLRAAELLVKAGLDVNSKGDMGYTPLHYARVPEVISFLLAQGASPSITNEFETSPIGWYDHD